MYRPRIRLAAVAVIATGALAATGSSAYAATPYARPAAAVLAALVPQTPAITGCPGGDPKYHHCYAIGRMGENWTGHFVAINAIGGDLHMTCLSVANPNIDFATYETWLSVDLNKYKVGTYWVEGGANDGIDVNGVNRGFQWFWAYNIPNGGYNEYYQGGASLGTYENVSFYWQGGGTWNVYFDGNLVGGVDAGAYGGGSDTGLETTTPQVYFNGYTRWWQYADNHNNWHPVDYAGYGEDLSTKGALSVNGYVHNDHPGDDVTEQGTNSNSCPIAKQRPQTFKGTAGLAALARLAARANRDPAPASVRYVRTSWDKTVSLTGARVTRTGPVYVLQLRGHFTGVDAKIPPGATPPTGTALTIVVDAATGTVIDTRLTRSAPSLTALGTVRSLAIP